MHLFYKRIDRELGEREYMAGERYTVADITALSGVDFATSLVGLPPDAGLKNLARWHQQVTARPSSQA